MDSEASNLSCSGESKHIEMAPAVLNNGRTWQKYVKLSLLKRLFRNKWAIVRRGAPAASRSKVIRYRRETPARTTRASFPACGSSVITSSDLRELADRSLSGDAPSSMSEPFRNWLGMGATIPARILPGSIDHVPFPNSCTLSWGAFGFTRESPPEKKVFLFPSRVIVRLRCVHRRGNRNASCSAGVA
ncbi:hypothetical protein MRB53_022955 [Persea americana]|uniref:Uncharacterized protein n=1 Tax=Persea americana TaxID=3435 RepID=A0ACC2L8E7_PERAE|nr:hypothetical protein MRB53_022955 [Persea americana]